MHIGYKIWLEMGGQMVFGLGLYNLLLLVDQTGSIHKAAETLHMSYRAAWGKIRTCEDRIGTDLVEKGRHGRAGNHLTEAGKMIITRYDNLLKQVEALVEDAPITELIAEIKQDIVSESKPGKEHHTA